MTQARYSQPSVVAMQVISATHAALRCQPSNLFNVGVDTQWPESKAGKLSASIYVLPSYREGTPRTILEAMAIALPIVTTDAPGCRETVINARNGFLVPVKDPHALAEAMLEFIVTPSRIEKMGRASRALAEERFDVQKVTRKIVDYIMETRS